ncbi:phosphotransferase family protein [Streptomyces avicenniae]|uniref:phosphotransferase family protein n=1 Tax=Streptomyces avicenniae TaxID=500153 RepID=UPI00167E64B3|nr:phosphotransferase [Streptomyces avicenniae]
MVEPTDAAVRRLLAVCRWEGIDPAAARVVADLTPGLSGATVLRVDLGAPGARGRSVVLKALRAEDDRGPGAFRRGPSGARREADVHRAGIVAVLTDEVVTPDVRAIGTVDGVVCLWFADVTDQLDVPWDVAAAVRAVEAVAGLHLGVLPPGTRGADWASSEYDAFRHHVPAATRRVKEELAGADGGRPSLVPPRDAGLALRLLDGAEDFARQLAAAPTGFQHGGFHTDNAGRAQDGRLLLIDWAQAGVGPLGGDIAVFLSNYQARGGDRGGLGRRAFDALITDAYGRALAARGADRALVRAARRVIDLWSVSWGVQVRLGPGLAAARDASLDPEVRASVAQDIAEGLARARDAEARLTSAG